MLRKSRCLANSSNTRKSPHLTLGYGKYILPRDGNIPAGFYYSEIVFIEDTITKRDKPAKIVYYKIAKFSDVYQKVNGIAPKGKSLNVLYIKQIYSTESEAYRSFLESMYEALGADYEEEIDESEFIGISEAISIGYVSKGDIGGIIDRTPYNEDDFVNLYIAEQDKCSYSEEKYEEYDEYDNEEYINLNFDF